MKKLTLNTKLIQLKNGRMLIMMSNIKNKKSFKKKYAFYVIYIYMS